MVVNIKGRIANESERQRLHKFLHKDKKFSIKEIPTHPVTELPLWEVNCLGYRDDMLGIGEWAKTKDIDTTGEIHKTHWYTQEPVNVDVVQKDLVVLSKFIPSADLIVLLGNPNGGLKAEWILRLVGGKVKRYSCYGESKLRWFTEEEIKSRMNPILKSCL